MMPKDAPEENASLDRYLEEVRGHPGFETRSEEQEVARRAQEGDEDARKRLISANLPFVISYVTKYQGWGLSLAELIAAGNEGLVKAADRFDPDRGVKFISYAVWWIKATVRSALAELSCPVRIPANKNNTLVQIPRVEASLSEKFGRNPTVEETADALDEDATVVMRLKAAGGGFLELNRPVDENDPNSTSFSEYVDTEQGEESHAVVAERNTRMARLREILAERLTTRERMIVATYYGLDGNPGATLGEIGDAVGLSRERIRQLRNRALAKLKESDDRELLRLMWRESA